MTATKEQVQAKITAIADAIRSVNGESGTMSMDTMATAVSALHDDNYVNQQKAAAVGTAMEEIANGTY